jgi:D-glucosaminate-6-phosphate ammonia-lyase
MNSYLGLPIEPVINVVGPATRFGGVGILADEVWEAMRESHSCNVRIDELEVAAGTRIADLLGVPGAYITTGASAALSVAAAVLVDMRGGRHPGHSFKLAIQAAQTEPHDVAFAVAGLELVPIGFPALAHPQELREALGPDVIGVVFRTGAAWQQGELINLRTVCEIAHEAGAHVIVDAAMTVPPTDRLHAILADGADFVAISGGKLFRGPQASGLLIAAPELLDEVARLHQDMSEPADTWERPSFVRGSSPTLSSLPRRHGVGRGMKVGREQVAGLLAAVERYIRNPDEDQKIGVQELEHAETILRTSAVLSISRDVVDDFGGMPMLEVSLPANAMTADELIRRLLHGTPRVAAGALHNGALAVLPHALLPGQGEQVGHAFLRALGEEPA